MDTERERDREGTEPEGRDREMNRERGTGRERVRERRARWLNGRTVEGTY